jgi:hypothetical protein
MSALAAPSVASSQDEALGCLRAMTQLAAVLVRPLMQASPGRSDLAPLDAAAAKMLAENPHFRRPLNRTAARRLGFDRLAVGRAEAERIRTEALSHLAFKLISTSLPGLERVSRLVAAAITHRQALASLHRDRLASLSAALGPEAATLAFREAPVLHAPLARLDRSRLVDEVTRVEMEAAARSVRSFGLAAFAGYLAHVEPAFLPLFALRLDEEAQARHAGGEVAPFDELAANHVHRLILRTSGPWLASAN